MEEETQTVEVPVVEVKEKLASITHTNQVNFLHPSLWHDSLISLQITNQNKRIMVSFGLF